MKTFIIVPVKAIILLAEQGLGDQIQFARYAKTLSDMGAQVTVECSPKLASLLATCPGIDRLVAKGQKLPAADFHCPVMSVAAVLREDFSKPVDQAYLFADENHLARWSDRLAEVQGFRIGASWQGNPDFKSDKWRSFPLQHFEAIGALEAVSLVSLQKGEKGVCQIADFRKQCPLIDPEEMLDDESNLMDAAAIIRNLDLIITSCTAIAHLGGALGVPTWVVLARDADWRWFTDRDDSPWYPSVRLFRQKSFGDWAEVFERLATAVQDDISSTASGMLTAGGSDE